MCLCMYCLWCEMRKEMKREERQKAFPSDLLSFCYATNAESWVRFSHQKHKKTGRKYPLPKAADACTKMQLLSYLANSLHIHKASMERECVRKKKEGEKECRRREDDDRRREGKSKCMSMCVSVYVCSIRRKANWRRREKKACISVSLPPLVESPWLTVVQEDEIQRRCWWHAVNEENRLPSKKKMQALVEDGGVWCC